MIIARLECSFFRKLVYERFGGYDLNFHMYAFWEFLCRIAKGGARIYVHPEQVLTSYRTSLSDSVGWNTPAAWAERLEVARRYGGWQWAYYQRRHGRLPRQEEFERTAQCVCRRLHLHPRRWLGQVKARKQAFKVRALYGLASAWLEQMLGIRIIPWFNRRKIASFHWSRKISPRPAPAFDSRWARRPSASDVRRRAADVAPQ
jgi:hypothetical protein